MRKFYKICTKCLQEQPVGSFTVGRRICRDCYKAKYQLNKPKQNEEIAIPKKYLRYCLNCNKKISAERYNKKYCNRNCFTLANWYKETKTVSASCHTDRPAILRSGGDCAACYQKKRNTERILKEIKGEPKRVPFAGKTCPNCKKFFRKANHPEQIYCSKKCAFKIRRGKSNAQRRQKCAEAKSFLE